MGRLLGDPEVWDDSPSRPRVLVRGLVGLAAGLVAGGLVALAVVPRPAAVPPEVVVPSPPAEGPRVRVEQQTLYNVTLSAGPLLLTRSGRLEQVKPDGTDRRVVAQNVRASAVVGPDRDGGLVVLDSSVIVRVDGDGATTRLGPANFLADGLAGRDGRLLACAEPSGSRRPDAGLLMMTTDGRSRPVRLGCPVAWASDAEVIAGAGGPWAAVKGIERNAAVQRGASVMIGRPGGRLRVLLGARELRAAAGRRATVEAVALTPDGKLAAVATGSPGRPWVVLVLRADGRRLARIPLAAGHRPAWIGWSDRHGTVTLAVAAVDRHGDLATAPLASRRGGGYVLAWDAGTRTARVLAAGAPMVAADGFAWSSDGESVGISSPSGLLLVLQIDVVYTTAAPVTGTLVAWPREAVP
ncbi:MAG TPA: hypothetical protein VFU54_15125 [Actinomycetota bacterium]|nr:hypothetical protein [Actinomycetota bacterium]